MSERQPSVSCAVLASRRTVLCSIGRCDPQTGQCALADAPNGTGCDDLDDCTTGDACNEGDCRRLDFPVCGEQAQVCEPFSPIDTIESSQTLEFPEGEDELLHLLAS